MQTEEKRKIHAPGHETHDVHICHKCGWTFPNPHPSAKHRRAHKKVCGKINGFKLIDSEDMAHSDDDVSDDDQHPSVKPITEESPNEKGSSIVKVEGTKIAKEEVLYLNRLLFDSVEPIIGGGLDDKSRSVTKVQEVKRIEGEVLLESVVEFTDAGSGPVAKEAIAAVPQEPDHDLENSTAESTDVLQPNDLTQGNQIRNPDAFKSEPTNLDSSIHVQDYTFPSTDVIGRSISDINAHSVVLEPGGDKASPVEPETPSYDYVENTHTDTGDVVECSTTEIDPSLHVEADEENAETENLPNVEMLPSILTSDISEINSSLHKSGITELEVPLNLPNTIIEAMDASSKDVVVDFKEPDSTICHAQEEQTDASGRKIPQNEAIPSAHQASMETEDDEYLGDFASTAQVREGGLRVDSKQEVNIENPSYIVEACGQHGVEKNSQTFSLSTGVLGQNICETTPQVCKYGLVQQEVSLISSIAEAIGSTEFHVHSPVQVEAHPSFMSDKSIETAYFFPSSKQVQEDSLQLGGTGSKTTQEELIVNQSGLDRDHIDERSQFVGLDFGGCAVEGLQSNEPEAHPETSNGDSIVNKATTLDDVVVGSSKLDATGNHLEENKLNHFFGEDEPHHGLSHKIRPETPVVDASGGETLGSAVVGSVVCQETAVEIGGYDAAHKESKDGHTVGGGDYNQEGAKDRHSPSSTEITHESATNESETKPRFHADPEMDELEGNQQVVDSPLLSMDVSLKGIDSHTHHLDNSSEPYSIQRNNVDEVSQESSQQLGLGNCADTSVIKEKAQVGHNETDSRLSGNLHEDLKSNQGSEVGLCQFDTQNSKSEKHACPSSLSLENCRSRDFSEGHASDIHYRSVQEGGDDTILKQSSNASAFSVDASGNSISQTDSAKGCWGSVSEPQETDNRLSGHLHEELKSNQCSEVGLCQFDTRNLTSEEYACSSSLSLENCSSRDFAQGGASDDHYHFVQKEGDNTILRQNSNASMLTMDAPVDSISQTDSVTGYWGSVSDGIFPSTRDTTDAPTFISTEAAPNISIQTSMETADAVLKKNSTSKKHRADSTDLFDAPSFMTLVEPSKATHKQHASVEIHSDPKPQRPNSPTSQSGWFPSLQNVVNESQGRKKNKEIIEKVVNWSSGKTHTSLSRLLVEANLESKHKSLVAQERTTLITCEDQVSQDIRFLGKTTKIATVSSAKGTTNKECNSPARLPIAKQEKRKIWVPFMCCSSIN